MNNRRAAWCVRDACGHIRTGHRDLADRGHRPRMPPVVETGLRRLPGRVDERRAGLDEGDTELVRARPQGDARREILVEQRVVAVGRLLDREGGDRLPVDQDQQLVRTVLAQPADGSRQVAREQHLHHVLAVLDEGVGPRHAPTRPDRQSWQLVFLRQVGWQQKHVVLQRGLRASDGQAADLVGGRDIPVQECRRQVADIDVVEAVAALIRGQERGGVDVERQQISDRVLILGSIQAPQRFGATRTRMCGCRRIERPFQPRQHRQAVGLRRLRYVVRRHDARVQLADDRFPQFGLRLGPGHVHLVQAQAASLQAVVVAGRAVASEELTLSSVEANL